MAKSSTSFKKGQVANPKGAPRRGESWAELFNQVGEMTTDDVEKLAAKLAVKFRAWPKGIKLKTLVVIRAYGALLDESNARLLKEVMDRAEGRTAQPITGTGEDGEIVLTIKQE